MASYRRTIAAAIATICVSVALYPIFTGISWFWAGAGAAITIAIAGTLTRLRRLPLVVCVAAGLALLLIYLNLVFSRENSFLAVVPTPASLSHLRDLAGNAVSESGKYAPPVPELSGMVLLAAGGIGLTALLVDLIAVRLQSAALAGLPMLLLFTEPFTLSISRGWLGTTVVFCLATAGYLTLLSTEGRERIREWEQPRPGAAGVPVPDTRALAAAGRRVGTASVVLALFIPLFVPGLHMTRLFGGGRPGIGGGSGAGGVGIPDPQTQLSRELNETAAVPVLRYTSTAAVTGYLQAYVLDNLTTSGWHLFAQPSSLSPADTALPSPPGLTNTAAGRPETATVTMSGNITQDVLDALPAPYPVRTVYVSAGGGTLRVERNTLMIFDDGAQFAGLRYSIISEDITPTAQDLANAPAADAGIRAHYLQVPASYDSLRQLAETITVGASTPYAKALALQNWFTSGAFTYTLKAPTIMNAAGLANFMDKSRSGYCQQFSFAMAVLARLVGIPSRVAYGFTQGTRQKDGTWLVTTHDAHAWPELYFQGFGWLRFEPTPQGAGGQGTATSPAYTQQSTGTPNVTSPVTNPPNPASGSGRGGAQSAHNHQRQQFPEGGYGGTALPSGAARGMSPWELAGLSLLGLLVVLAAVPGCARSVIRRRRWRAGSRTASADAALADAAWRELCDDLADYGAGYHASESPRALADRVSTELKLTTTASEALRRVTMAAERARYSARPASGATLRRDSTTIRRAIAASAPRRTQWRARVFPPSVVSPAAQALRAVTNVFGQLTLRRPPLPRRAEP
jgi:transglutaminase-like putative cysteine protease